jgi:hypothetical protein
MKKQHLATLFLLVVFLVATQAAAAEPAIIGAPKCKICHTAKTGNQWEKWLDSNHAKAFTALASDEAKQIAAAQGLGDPQQEQACLKCHTTQGFLGTEVAVDAKAKYDASEGVGCESCHGAGSAYKGRKVMQDADASKAAGLLRDRSAAFCTKCHNEESPTFKGFDFEESWAKIAHPVTESE